MYVPTLSDNEKCQITVEITKQLNSKTDNQITLKITAMTKKNTKIKKKYIKLIIYELLDIFKSRLETELSVHLARTKNNEKTQQIYHKMNENIKKQRVRDILNPKKSARVSSTGRKGNSESTGRFTPSSATQARRTIKKGG